MSYHNCLFIILLILLAVFTSCNTTTKLSDTRWKYLGFYNSTFLSNRSERTFFSNDTSSFRTLEEIFTIDGYNSPVFTDSSVIRSVFYDVSGRNVCCETDTLSYFIENINSRNYLFLTNNYGIEVLLSETFKPGLLKKRPVIKIPSIVLNIGSYIKENLILDSIGIQADSATQKADTVKYHFYKKDHNLGLQTLKAKKTGERILLSVTKEMNAMEVDQFLRYFQTTYPGFPVNDYYNEDCLRNISIYFMGLSISIIEKKGNIKPKNYTFYYDDDYLSSLPLLKKRGKKWILINDKELSVSAVK